jgi:hypothetical protein
MHNCQLCGLAALHSARATCKTHFVYPKFRAAHTGGTPPTSCCRASRAARASSRCRTASCFPASRAADCRCTAGHRSTTRVTHTLLLLCVWRSSSSGLVCIIILLELQICLLMYAGPLAPREARSGDSSRGRDPTSAARRCTLRCSRADQPRSQATLRSYFACRKDCERAFHPRELQLMLRWVTQSRTHLWLVWEALQCIRAHFRFWTLMH